MKAFPCRCRKCGARKTFAMQPTHYEEEPLCPCGGKYRVDWYRKKREHKERGCICDGYSWAIDNAPHRKGSPNCYYRLEKEYEQRQSSSSDQP